LICRTFEHAFASIRNLIHICIYEIGYRFIDIKVF